MCVCVCLCVCSLPAFSFLLLLLIFFSITYVLQTMTMTIIIMSYHIMIIYCDQAAQRRLLDIANTLNLSRSLMRVIENRQKMDRMLVYGGMALVSLVTLLLWYYLT